MLRLRRTRDLTHHRHLRPKKSPVQLKPGDGLPVAGGAVVSYLHVVDFTGYLFLDPRQSRSTGLVQAMGLQLSSVQRNQVEAEAKHFIFLKGRKFHQLISSRLFYANQHMLG